MSGEARFRDCYFTVADGLRLHYRDYPGDFELLPLLCLHGLTRNARDFEEFAEHHSPVRRVIALDFRGRGASAYDPQPDRYTPLVYAGDVVRLMDHLGFAEAVFVGTSLGGLVTMTLVASEPERIAATILNDVGPELNEAGLERIKTYVGKGAQFRSWEEAGAAIAANSHNLPESFGAKDWARMARKHCRQEGEDIVFDYDQAIAIPFHTKGAAPNVDLWPSFRKLAEKPMLVLRGEKSDLVGKEAMERMRAVAPTVVATTVPGVGHAPMLDEPIAVAAIDAFLAHLPGTGHSE